MCPALYVVLGTGLVAAAVWLARGGGMRLATRAVLGRSSAEREGDVLGGRAGGFGRRESRGEGGGGVVASAPLPPDVRVPSNAAELAELVAWLRSRGHDELLRLSNAEYDFMSSELIQRLQGLEGPWVVQALGQLAVAEADPLLKAILVKGLVGAPLQRRWSDGELVPILDALLVTMTHASDDPYQVAQDLATAALGASTKQGIDYVRWMQGFLAASDDPSFLHHGYLYMGVREGGGAVLAEALLTHSDADGRMGALEGLRNGATSARVPPEEITRLGMEALASEASERNRLLLYEMVIATGGPEGLDRIEEGLRSGRITEVGMTAEFLALELEPARAQALFQDLLREPTLQGAAKEAVYRALGLIPGAEGEDLLLGVARNEALGVEDRLAGLRGLWSRTEDERVLGEIRGVFESSGDPELRTEAMRMLACETGESKLDYRAIAALDEDVAVRAEAVRLAAMQGTEDLCPWLEERLFQDDSLDVKAAALGALVLQSHYTGEGEAVLDYLERARGFTDDEDALAMIAEGERMVKSYDPRELDLGLAQEARFWGSIARYADGPAAASFERRARQLDQIVSGLRRSRDGTRAAR